FMLQACGLLVVPLARLLDRGRGLPVVASVLLAIHVFTGQGWPVGAAESDPPWDLSPLIPNQVSPLIAVPYVTKMIRGTMPAPSDVTSSLAMVAFGAGSLAGAWLWSRPGQGARVRAVLGTIVLAAGAIGISSLYQPGRVGSFYAPFPEYYKG